MNVIEQGIAVVCKVLLWVSTAVTFVILVANTILRYATGASLQWANEVPELLFPWLVMSGVVLAALHSAHITTSFLMDKLGYKARRIVITAGWLIVCVLYAVLAKATFQMLEIVHDEKSPILQLPGSITYGCVLVGMVMLGILALFSAWRAWKFTNITVTKDAPPAAVHW
jgi:TRAP-type transport system small permease protein